MNLPARGQQCLVVLPGDNEPELFGLQKGGSGGCGASSQPRQLLEPGPGLDFVSKCKYG